MSTVEFVVDKLSAHFDGGVAAASFVFKPLADEDGHIAGHIGMQHLTAGTAHRLKQGAILAGIDGEF